MNLKLFFTGIFFWLGQLYFAQPVTINLSEDNIINRTEYNQILQSGVLYKGNGNWRSAGGEWYVMLKANQSTYSNGNFTLPTEIVNFRLNNINGVTPGTGQLKGIWPGYKNITTTFQSFFQPEKANSNAPKGAIMMNYQILSSSFPNYIFQSGSYIVSIDNNQAPNGTWWSSTNRYIDPSGWQMNISVPEFAKWFVTQNAFTYNYNSLSNFSSPQDLVFDLSNFQISHTTDAYLDAKAQGNISFTPHGGGVATDIPISNVEVFGTGLTTKTLSTSYQNINSSAYSVITGNRNTIPIKIRINANAVKQQLYRAGTYTFTVDFKIRNNGGTVSDTQSVPFTITTQPLSTIAIQGTPDVNFTFATAADYQTGKSQNMANHL
ncbi:MAG: hypothetical protein JST62_00075, partial [Bacteroidetes bacterium]|nr:hypothetical protein [Bacteroidota bacterium]